MTGAVVAVALVVGAVVLSGCRATPYPLQNTQADRVTAITVSDHHDHRVRISSPTEIQLFLDRTRNLPSRSDPKVTVEFEVMIELQDGSTIPLRMSKECIGPGVAASASVTRWYFQDSTLYDFVKARLRDGG